MMSLTKAERAALEDADSNYRRMGWALFGSREHRRSTLKRLEVKGLLKWEPHCVVCDGDGFRLEPERGREGWFITNAGTAMLAHLISVAAQ